MLKSLSLYSQNIIPYFHKKKSVTFTGTPKKLEQSKDYKINYQKLQNGSYLDVHDDSFAPQNKYIREQNFSEWGTDKKFEFVKTLIKYSCEDQDNFYEYFKNDRDIKQRYKNLLSKLTNDYKFICERKL